VTGKAIEPAFGRFRAFRMMLLIDKVV